MAKELRDLIEAAESAINVYRRPNIDEAKERLSGLLKAAGMGGIGEFDSIDSISEEDGSFHIRTSYAIRGCENTDSYELPSAIVDADDPLAAARAWSLNQQISVAEERVKNLRDGLWREERKLAKLRATPGMAPVPASPPSLDGERMDRLEQLYASTAHEPEVWRQFMQRVAEIGFREAIDGVAPSEDTARPR